MPQAKLTKRVVDAVGYEGEGRRAHYVWDTELRGFGLRCYPSGRKVFLITYRVSGRKRFTQIGAYGRYTVEEARRRARRMLQEADGGRDFSREKTQRREAPTVRDLYQRFVSEHGPKLKQRTLEEYDRLWRVEILPALTLAKVEDVHRTDIEKLMAARRARPYVANRMHAVLSKAFNLAEAWDWRPQYSNPCRHVERFKETARRRYLSAEELGRLAKALSDYERDFDRREDGFRQSQRARPTTHRRKKPVPARQLYDQTALHVVAAIRLLLLTGCRVGEILSLRWQDVDLPRRVLVLQDSKTGPREVLLNGPALEVLSGLKHRQKRLDSTNPYVIRGREPGTRLVNLKKPWRRLTKIAELEDVRLHDLRHTHASWAISSGAPLEVVGALLGHRRLATTQRYAHLRDDPLRRAADRLGAELAGAGLISSSDEDEAELLRFELRE